MELWNDLVEPFAISPCSIHCSQLLVEQKASPTIFDCLTFVIQSQKGPIDVQQKLEFCKTVDAVISHFSTSCATNMFLQIIMAPKEH